MIHPHNASPADYAAALNATATLVMASNRAEEAGYALVFNTIEATDARKDAIAVRKAIFDAQRACHAAMDAIHAAKQKADAREDALASIEAGQK
jgi:hypothetical protein